MQAIAKQNNLSETAFIVPLNHNTYTIRWFSTTQEHATLATAYVIFKYLENNTNEINFESITGLLKAKIDEGYIELLFPAKFSREISIPTLIKEAINYEVRFMYLIW